MADITIIENKNGEVIRRTISEKSYEMMSETVKARFVLAPKAEPKKIAIPQETIEMMEQLKPQENDNPKQENIEAVENNESGLVKTKRTRQKRTV